MPPPASRPPLSRLRRLCDLPSEEKRLLLEAWWTLLAASARLRLAARRTLTRALASVPHGVPPEVAGTSSGNSTPGSGKSAGTSQPGTSQAAVALAVSRAAAHHLWAMTCLPRALALQRMLARRGIAAALRIGVRKEAGTLAAHAWVEVGGLALGEPEEIAERFRALLPAAGGTDRRQAP